MDYPLYCPSSLEFEGVSRNAVDIQKSFFSLPPFTPPTLFFPWPWWFRYWWPRSSPGWCVTQQNFRHLSGPAMNTKTSPSGRPECVWRMSSTSTRGSAAWIARPVRRKKVKRESRSHYGFIFNHTEEKQLETLPLHIAPFFAFKSKLDPTFKFYLIRG